MFDLINLFLPSIQFSGTHVRTGTYAPGFQCADPTSISSLGPYIFRDYLTH